MKVLCYTTIACLTAISLCKPPLKADHTEFLNRSAKKVKDRLLVPDNYIRLPAPKDSFGDYLLNLPLKPDGTRVRLYNGAFKKNQSAHVAVVDLEIENRDLHQCADALMRLRSEYLYKTGNKNRIRFHLTNRFLFDYRAYSKGNRLAVSGNRTWWKKTAKQADSFEQLQAYLRTLYTYAGTISIQWDSEPVSSLSGMKRGDFFLQSGSPGHAVIVLDVIKKKNSDSLAFALAQSYMPAQELHILKNPEGGVYYYLEEVIHRQELRTPEWTFSTDSLRRFKN